jgi:hypothetical protein
MKGIGEPVTTAEWMRTIAYGAALIDRSGPMHWAMGLTLDAASCRGFTIRG